MSVRCNRSLGSGLAIVSSTLRRRSYPEAPVSPLLLLAGHIWARVLLMVFSAAATMTAFVDEISGSDAVDLARLPTVASSIVVMMALSSYRAREYATRRQHRPRKLSRTPIGVLPSDHPSV